jgi:hypothetical protein
MRSDSVFKLGYHKDNELKEYAHPDLYNLEQSGGAERVVIGLSKSHVDAVLELAALFCEPFYIIYVLHTSHNDNEYGRYQSKEISYSQVSTLFTSFKDFFENDSRHDVWLRSPQSNATIVYDRHNLIYLYGFVDKQLESIEGMGLEKKAFSIPFPHIHCYHAEYDIFETKLINDFE